MSVAVELFTEIPITETRPKLENDLGAAVRSLLGTQFPRVGAERRREHRYPFPYPIRLTPVTSDGSISPAESVVVLGKHLTEHGVDFYFNEPLAYRRVIASFERGGREVVHITMELTWCRFGRHGWYENGGRFLQLLASSRLTP